MTEAPVRLWSVDLACPSRPELERLRTLLDAEERARMDRLRPPTARARFVAAHAALRLVLGAAVGWEPAAVRLTRESGGKPRLEGPGPAFNMAHSGDVAAIAVGGRAALGVDVEVLRAVPRLEAMIRYACAPAERAELMAEREDGRRTERFLKLWVRKEAVLKAAGRGLREHPARIAVGWGDRAVVTGRFPPMHLISTHCLGQPTALAIVGGTCRHEAVRFEWANPGGAFRHQCVEVI